MVEIVEVWQNPTLVDAVGGALDSPVAGWHGGGHAFTVSGWLLGATGPFASVAVEASGTLLRHVEVAMARPDIEAVAQFAQIPWRGRCGFAAHVGLLGLGAHFDLQVIGVTHDGTRHLVATIRGTRDPLLAASPGGLLPIMVTGLGRSGTTLLMEMLSAHPDIVVDTTHPYETRCATYWMHMLKATAEPGVVVPPVTWYSRFDDLAVVHPLPFADPHDAARDWLAGEYAERMAAFCRSSLDGFYSHAADTQRKRGVTAFAEKQTAGIVADVLDEVYPNRVELISLRDPRDMLISIIDFLSRGHTVLGHRPTDSAASIARQFTTELTALVERRQSLGAACFDVRYEDLITAPHATLGAALRYARLPESEAVVAAMVGGSRADPERWAAHRTSADVARSLVRWREPGNENALRAWTDELEDLTLALGYPPSTFASAQRAASRSGPVGAVTADLRAELDAAQPWMYEWDLGGGLRTMTGDPELQQLHQTRLELMESSVRAVLDAAVAEARVLDVACNEGWFGHRLLDMGAACVHGVDVRAETVARAVLVRDHLGVAPERLQLSCANLYELDVAAMGIYDVVLMLGLLYHLEEPVRALRIARRLTRTVCVIECKVSRHNAPVVHAVGASGATMEAMGSFATRVEMDAENNPAASVPGILSLVPNRYALEEMALTAGFSRVTVPVPRPHHSALYRNADRVVMLAWVGE